MKEDEQQRLNQAPDSAEDKGRPTDPKYDDGPLEERGCTDMLCCLIFVAFIICTVILSYYGFKNGQPSKLLVPYDPDHRACGVDKAVKDYPYIYFVAPSRQTLWRTVCLKECPKNENSQLLCAPNSVVKSCKANKMTTAQKIAKKKYYQVKNSKYQYLFNENEPVMNIESFLDYQNGVYVYPTVGYAKRVCLPSVSKFYRRIKTTMNIGAITTSTNDIKQTWTISVASAFIALFIALFFVFLMRYCAGVVIWIFIIMFILSFLLMGLFFTMKYKDMKLSYKNGKISYEKAQISQQNQSKTLLLVLAITFFAATLLSILLIIALRRRISIAIGVMETASLFVTDNKSSLILPIMTFLALVLFVAWWTLVALYLYSAGEVTKKEKRLPFATFKHDRSLQYLGLFHFFALFWILSFIISCGDFILCCASSIWYFTKGDSNRPNPIMKSFKYLFRYHLGSIAFGSLILAIVWIIQAIMEYFSQKARQYQDNIILQYVIKCCQCCIACFERFIRFINQAAYTIIAMTGQSFCPSAKDAFMLTLRNPIRFSIVTGIGEIFTVVGKIFVCLLTALIGYIIITKADYYSKSINSPIAPTILFAIIGYNIGSIFMGVYGTVADAILIVFTMDEEIQKHHKQNYEHPFRAPEPLKKFLDQHQAKD